MTLVRFGKGIFFDCFKLPGGISGDVIWSVITGRQGVRLALTLDIVIRVLFLIILAPFL